MNEVSLPIACNLTAPEFQERRNSLLLKASEAVLESVELADGYAYRFPSESSWITELAHLITLERQCCPFLQFNLRLEPSEGPIWLELSGPPGTKEFLTSLFSK